MAQKVAFNSLRKLSLQDRRKAATSDSGPMLLSLMTPAQVADLFPDYYRRNLPDVSGFRAAISKSSAAQQQSFLEKLKSSVADVERKGERWAKRLGDRLDEVKETISERVTGGSRVPSLNKQADSAWRKLHEGDLSVDSDEGKELSKLNEKQLEQLGIQKAKDKDGRQVYHYTPPQVGKEEIENRLKSDYQSGTSGLAGKKALQKMVYDGYRSAGFSDAQSRALTAEVGRENGYNAATLFGTHEIGRAHV